MRKPSRVKLRYGTVAALTLLAHAVAADCDSTIYEATLAGLKVSLDQGCMTSVQLVQRYLDRIDAYEPRVEALIVTNPGVLQRAGELDAERAAGHVRGPLHGIPILVKDNIDTADMATTAGTIALRHSRPAADATIVRRLREAGALVLAKTNMSELAQSYGRLGYSAVGGQTRNPYDLTRDASGSSTGSAVGLAANFGVLAIGTDTAGSVRGPASTTGLVGLRPTVGLVSRNGVVPVSYTLDTPGPMARSVYGVAAMLDAMAGPDDADPRTLVAAPAVSGSYVEAIDDTAVAGRRIGVARDFMGGHPDVDAAVEQSLERLRTLGIEVVEVVLPEAVRIAGTHLPQVIAAEFPPLFEAYLRGLGDDSIGDIESVADAATLWGEALPDHAMNPALLKSLDKAKQHPGLADSDYLYTISYRYPAARSALLQLMVQQGLDGMVFPTLACPPAPLPGEPVGSYQCAVEDVKNAGYLRVASVTGFPDITIPAGRTTGGMPVGLSLLGRPYSESFLISLAYRLEKYDPQRVAPGHTPALHAGKSEVH